MTMKLDHLEKLYVAQLKDAYSAEKQLLEALPKMRDAARSDKLRTAFADHLAETKGHVTRLEKVFKGMDYKPGGERCEAMEGLVKEGEEVLKGDVDARVMDAALICAAQKVEHYEIATYGCLRTYARILGRDDAAAILEETLDEEKKADDHLSELAEQWINAFAMRA